MELRNLISKLLRENLNRNIFSDVKKKGNNLYFYIDGNEIGYVEYYYDGSAISEHVPPTEKEFYLAMIEVHSEYRNQNLADSILNYIKEYAKNLGATIITLKVDYGIGYGNERNPNGYLDRLYLKNGFKYSFTEEECKIDDSKNLGAMYYKLA